MAPLTQSQSMQNTNSYLAIPDIVDLVVQFLDARDVIALARSCKSLWALLAETDGPSEGLWKRRIQRDLRFPVASTARSSGWLDLYRRISRPHVYLWGEAKNSRLAIDRRDPRIDLLTRTGGIPVPARLEMPCSIIDIVAGGWSFHALSVSGDVYHWGQLDGMMFASYRPPTAPWPENAHPGNIVVRPARFVPEIPPIQRLLSGRAHALALDIHGKLWTWATWAEAARIDGLECLQHPPSRIRDFAAGWNTSAILVDTHPADRAASSELKQEVLVFWQKFLSPTFRQHRQGLQPECTPIDGLTSCFSWQPRALRLPDLATGDHGPDAISEDIPKQFIKQLAAGDGFLIALTSIGRLYKIDLTPPDRLPTDGGNAPGQDDDDEDGRLPAWQMAALETLCLANRRTWQYLPRFSESQNWDVDTSEDSEVGSSGKARITHISAKFETFFAIAPGVVLQGNGKDVNASSRPFRKPGLQNRNVIRVECGDYHYGALTGDGKVLTFGQYSNGALGHGEGNDRLPQATRGNGLAVQEPADVQFFDPLHSQPRSDEYCFNIAMAGWHSAALTFDTDSRDATAERQALRDEARGRESSHTVSSHEEGHETANYEGVAQRDDDIGDPLSAADHMQQLPIGPIAGLPYDIRAHLMHGMLPRFGFPAHHANHVEEQEAQPGAEDDADHTDAYIAETARRACSPFDQPRKEWHNGPTSSVALFTPTDQHDTRTLYIDQAVTLYDTTAITPPSPAVMTRELHKSILMGEQHRLACVAAARYCERLEQAGIDISFDAPSKTWIPNTIARNAAREHTISQSHGKAAPPVVQPVRTQSRFASLFAQLSTNVIQPTPAAHNNASTDTATIRSSHKIIPGAVRFPKRAAIKYCCVPPVTEAVYNESREHAATESSLNTSIISMLGNNDDTVDTSFEIEKSAHSFTADIAVTALLPTFELLTDLLSKNNQLHAQRMLELSMTSSPVEAAPAVAVLV